MIKGQNQGFNFETYIKSKINGFTFNNLDPKLKPFFLSVDSNLMPTDFFTVPVKTKTKRGINRKTDIFIEKNGYKFSNVSLKTGNSNSIHQENINEFVSFLSSHGASESLLNELKFFHWGDGSIDGSFGAIDFSKRMKANKIKVAYHSKIIAIQQLFKQYSLPILERVFLGGKDGTEPDFLLYSESKALDLDTISFKKMDDVIHFHAGEIVTGSDVGIGNLTFQNWNRCLGGQDLKVGADKHRNDIQFKWSCIKDDL